MKTLSIKYSWNNVHGVGVHEAINGFHGWLNAETKLRCLITIQVIYFNTMKHDSYHKTR